MYFFEGTPLRRFPPQAHQNPDHIPLARWPARHTCVARGTAPEPSAGRLLRFVCSPCWHGKRGGRRLASSSCRGRCCAHDKQSQCLHTLSQPATLRLGGWRHTAAWREDRDRSDALGIQSPYGDAASVGVDSQRSKRQDEHSTSLCLSLQRCCRHPVLARTLRAYLLKSLIKVLLSSSPPPPPIEAATDLPIVCGSWAVGVASLARHLLKRSSTRRRGGKWREERAARARYQQTPCLSREVHTFPTCGHLEPSRRVPFDHRSRARPVSVGAEWGASPGP